MVGMASERMQAPENSSELLTKKEWHDQVQTTYERSVINKTSLSVIFLDIDYMKWANDHLGHAYGDVAIEHLSSTIQTLPRLFRVNSYENQERELDTIGHSTASRLPDISIPLDDNSGILTIPGRIGGDEFAIICHTDAVGAAAIKSRIQSVFREGLDKTLAQEGVDVGIGVATLEEGMSLSELLKKADNDLYADKLSHLKELSPEQIAKLKWFVKELTDMGIRQRDISKYIKLYIDGDTGNEELPATS